VYPIIFLLMILSAMDIFDLLGRRVVPDTLINTGCHVFPYAKIISFIFPTDMLVFIRSSCNTGAIEPAASMVFFMLKLCIGVLFIIPIIVFVCVRPMHFFSVRNTFFEKFQRPNGVKIEMKKFTSLMITNISIWAGGIYMIAYSKPPERYVALPMHKFLEDGAAMLTFIVVMYGILFLTCLGSYLLMPKDKNISPSPP
jgi:hypothetical protein